LSRTIIKEWVRRMAGKKQKRGGVGAFLAGIRLLFNNPVTRRALLLASKEYACRYGEKEVKAPVIYHSLASIAGEPVECPLTAGILMNMIKKIIMFGVHLLKGDEEEVKKALSDPAIRRGITLVMKGLGMYGVTVPQKMPAPFLIVWNFTNMCNFRCKHCYQRADRPLPDELSLEEKIMLVDQLDKAGVAAVALSGGEPTIHPHFLRIVREIASRGMYVAVATNGWVFADIERLKKAKEAGLRYVEISVDSADPKKHDAFRGTPGAWEHAIKALENAVKLGINHAMAVTITKANLVDDILDLAESIGVKRVIFFNFIPVGRGVEISHLDLTPEERERFLRKLYIEMKKRKGMEIIRAPQYSRVTLQMSSGEEIAPTHFYVGGDPIVKSLAEFIGGCGAGRIYAAVQPNGDVTPCVFMPLKVGNIRETPFWEIWTKSPILLSLRDREKLKGGCAKCPYKYICGGCRARGYAYFNDPLAPDPGCIINLKYWKELMEKREVKITVASKQQG